jgi:hypothetical protein
VLEGILVGIIDASLLRKAMQFYTGVDTACKELGEDDKWAFKESVRELLRKSKKARL